MAILVVLAVLLIVVLIIFPMSAKIKFHLNLLTLSCEYSIKVLNIKLLCGRISVKNKEFIISNSHNKLFVGSKEQQKKQGLFVRQVLSQIIISRLELYFNFGIQDYALSAIICGFIQSVFSAFSAVAISKNPFIHIIEGVSPNFKTEQCDFAVQALLELSILDIIKSKIKANKLHKENIDDK